MRRILVFAGLLIFIPGFSQDETIKKLRKEGERTIKKDPADTIPKTWKKGGIYGLNIAQSTLNNWAAGGENFSLSINSLLSLFAFYKKDRISWDNTFDFNLGYIRTTSLGGRKNDDRFDLLSKYGYALHPKLDLACLLNLRSQVFRGYTFSDSSKTHSSGFLAPGYLLFGVGLDYKPVPNLSIYVSPATARLVIVKDTALANKGLYGVSPGKKIAFEFGGFATINYFKEFNKYITYKGRLDLFSNYRHHPQNIDIYFSNLLNARIGKAISIAYSLDLVYDDDVRLFGKYKNSAGLQLKSGVGIGILLKF